MKLKILVGTVTQTAQGVAQAIAWHCADLVDTVDIQPMEGLDLRVFDANPEEDAIHLICCSTHGSGDVPDGAFALYASFDAQPRYLGHVRYAVVALGDRSYGDTFCGGGRRFDDKLQDLGARRLVDVWCHDACTGEPPEAAAAEWCRGWLQAMLADTPG